MRRLNLMHLWIQFLFRNLINSSSIFSCVITSLQMMATARDTLISQRLRVWTSLSLCRVLPNVLLRTPSLRWDQPLCFTIPLCVVLLKMSIQVLLKNFFSNLNPLSDLSLWSDTKSEWMREKKSEYTEKNLNLTIKIALLYSNLYQIQSKKKSEFWASLSEFH